ncbi:hypothetical protein Tsubulata_024660, partial [Turnera subulata]
TSISSSVLRIRKRIKIYKTFNFSIIYKNKSSESGVFLDESDIVDEFILDDEDLPDIDDEASLDNEHDDYSGSDDDHEVGSDEFLFEDPECDDSVQVFTGHASKSLFNFLLGLWVSQYSILYVLANLVSRLSIWPVIYPDFKRAGQS